MMRTTPLASAQRRARQRRAPAAPPTPVEAVEAHFRAVVEKDAAEIIGRYAASPDLYVFVEGPRWSTVGHDAVAMGWRAFCDAAMSVRSINWVEGPRTGALGGGAWVGGVVDLDVELAEGERRTVRLRGTHILEKTASGWAIVHEHFSQPAADPYGIGDWLGPNAEVGSAKAEVVKASDS